MISAKEKGVRLSTTFIAKRVKKKVTKKIKRKAAKKAKAPGKTAGKKHPGSENLMPPWKPGESGNPKGTPKGPRLTTILRRQMAAAHKGGQAVEEIFIQAGIARACGKGASAAAFWKEIFARMDGKQEESVKVKGVNPLADALNEEDEARVDHSISELQKALKKIGK